MKFSNNKGAGVEYSGTFGTSSDSGKIIYLSFPIETVADDNVFNSVITKSMNYFEPGIVSVDDESNLVNEFNLFQNYPNPFNPSTKIKYTIPNFTPNGEEGSRVQLKVFDILGNEIATLVNEEKPAGTYEVDFNASSAAGGLSSGVYIYTLKVNGVSYSKSMMLMK
ncbi:MAG: T9SS type A sorting domain-containing protein [Ignavibacteriaceae bacterium]|nr:T9SS type A sorting domain-containing protein [Ignavibacterium sp.]MCC6256405.1 T9SS type A sorting domain-containing protein [Ignavibacteriaceae bacterium]